MAFISVYTASTLYRVNGISNANPHDVRKYSLSYIACMVSKCPSLTYREHHSTHLHGINMHCAHEQIYQECTLYSNSNKTSCLRYI